MKKILIGCTILSFFACSKKEETPISQEKMVDVLTDLTIASSSKTVSNRRDSIQYYTSHDRILKEHGLDSLQFVTAQEMYQRNPELYAVIYDSVTERIRKQLEQVRAEPSEKLQERKIIPAF